MDGKWSRLNETGDATGEYDEPLEFALISGSTVSSRAQRRPPISSVPNVRSRLGPGRQQTLRIVAMSERVRVPSNKIFKVTGSVSGHMQCSIAYEMELQYGMTSDEAVCTTQRCMARLCRPGCTAEGLASG